MCKVENHENYEREIEIVWKKKSVLVSEKNFFGSDTDTEIGPLFLSYTSRGYPIYRMLCTYVCLRKGNGLTKEVLNYTHVCCKFQGSNINPPNFCTYYILGIIHWLRKQKDCVSRYVDPENCIFCSRSVLYLWLHSGSERDQHFADVIYGLQIAKSGDASSSNTWVNGSKHPLKYF